MKFELQPRRGVLPVEIGMSVAALTAMFGDGRRQLQFGTPDESLSFAGLDLRVTIRDDQVVEASVAPPTDVRFAGSSLWRESASWQALVALEPRPLLSVGFLILPSLGIAFTGLHDGDTSQRAITVFKDGLWDSAISEAEPFTG